MMAGHVLDEGVQLYDLGYGLPPLYTPMHDDMQLYSFTYKEHECTPHI